MKQKSHMKLDVPTILDDVETLRQPFGDNTALRCNLLSSASLCMYASCGQVQHDLFEKESECGSEKLHGLAMKTWRVVGSKDAAKPSTC